MTDKIKKAKASALQLNPIRESSLGLQVSSYPHDRGRLRSNNGRLDNEQSPPVPFAVTQADRDAASHLAHVLYCGEAPKTVTRIAEGKIDHTAIVQAFARHRLSHSAEKEALIEVLEKIAACEIVDAMCDPGWAARIARSTLLSMRNNGNG